MAGMIIQHNLNAINANNKLAVNILGTKKATEKLSSGYRINRAADDAAGLAISEKMRAQLRGLGAAIRNANDGVSLIQTAEGALDETHSMLKRLKELSVLSGNGTYTDEERKYMQMEIDEIKTEIDRISKATEFNGIKLLDGSLGGKSSSTTSLGARYGFYYDDAAGYGSMHRATFTSNIEGVGLTITNDVATVGGAFAEWSDDGLTLTLNLENGGTYTQAEVDALIQNATQRKGLLQTNAPADVKLTLKNGFLIAGAQELTASGEVTEAGKQSTTGKVALDGAILIDATTGTATEKYASEIEFISNSYGPDTRKITIVIDAKRGSEKVDLMTNEDDENLGTKNGEYVLHLATGTEYSEKDIENLLAKAGLDYTVKLTSDIAPSGDATLFANTPFDKTSADGTFAGYTGDGTVATVLGTGVIGTGVGSDKVLGSGAGITFQIGANNAVEQRVVLNIKDMGSSAIGIGSFDVSTVANAQKAMGAVEKAIVNVSEQRASLGAMQNRLEHTIASLTTTHENLTAAEAQIRDTDMAMEMVEYTKFNILQQAAQAMLAQANQAPQAILQLLR